MSKTRGITLIEMLMVVAIVALIVTISFPSVTAGLESVRLAGATDDVVSFLNRALNHAERRRVPVEISIVKAERTLTMRSVEPGWLKQLRLPETVKISRLLPEIQGAEDNGRMFVIYPGGSVPAIGVELANGKGRRRIVRVDPITGAPQVEAPVE